MTPGDTRLSRVLDEAFGVAAKSYVTLPLLERMATKAR
jgi:hypothetical protein